MCDSKQEDHINILNVVSVMSDLKETVESQGIEIYEGRDIEQLEEKIGCTNKELTVLLSRRGNLYQPGDVFYLIGNSRETGEPVSLVAGRCDRFSGWSMRRYLEEYVPKVMTFSDKMPAKLAAKQPKFWNFKPKNPAYLCELWTDRSFRGRGIAQSMVKLGQLYAYLRWQPDLIWALMSDEDVAVKGLASKYGFSQVIEDALLWDEPPREIPSKVWYVANSTVHLCDLVDRHLRHRRNLQTQKKASNIRDLTARGG